MREIESFWDLVPHYDGFLFDAYGVLVDDSEVIPGAIAVWKGLADRGKPAWIVTNGSSRSLAQAARSYTEKGLPVHPEQIINSAGLLGSYFAEAELRGLKTAVLGTAASVDYVREAGGIPVSALDDDFEVLVVANQTEFPLLETLDAVLSRILQRVAAQQPCHLVLANPDLIYPKDKTRFGITAGALAVLLEAALSARLGPEAPRFVRLGKPHGRIFAEAVRRSGSRRLLMIGDQLETDIRGAVDFGLDSLLMGTGLIDWPNLTREQLVPAPTYLLRAWSPACS